ncbi:MAG: hypothetical protein JSR45_18475 [Proteobacteria bacterium]|nr:hypothetical protein [Pseudomonadota bacterium]
MKIDCPCGEVIHDSADSLPHKAWLLADQDLEAFYALTDKPHGAADGLSLARTAYQCAACGRLTLDDPVTGEMLWFAPEHDPRKRAFGSKLGNSYPVGLRGAWHAHLGYGDLFWGTSGDRPGGYERFENPKALEARYREVKAELQAQGRLRDASLDIPRGS